MKTRRFDWIGQPDGRSFGIAVVTGTFSALHADLDLKAANLRKLRRREVVESRQDGNVADPDQVIDRAGIRYNDHPVRRSPLVSRAFSIASMRSASRISSSSSSGP